ncbi:MAG TPA: sigma-54 dependent transcriptional regulator [Xanthobacteraceae bacterium]|nr:sigma-54 dependent transcriptional regulator [Xanthobacteraceae bacterium]
MAETILIVDDDPVQRRLVESMARRFGYEAIAVEGGDAAIKLLLSAEGPRVDAVVLDLVMPDLDGLGVLAEVREAGLTVPVIVQTAHGGIDNVISAMRAGAVDFVVKPVGAERLQVSLRNALAASALETEVQRFKRSRDGTLTFKDIISRSPRMQAVLKTGEKAAASAIPVLIEGESGVGKELIARAIHGSGERRSKPFVAVNCGAIPDNLVESTLFGHEKGAFTGATERHAGKFVEASGGTLFLDEVGELPLAAQVKLLRAIQEGEVDPVGGRKSVKVDVRLMSASNRNLIAAVKEGRFREDLFYRLHVFPITVPPLRERPEDIADLVRHFLVRFNAEEGKRIRVVAADAMALLARCSWPGNVRQLENAIFRAVVLAEGDEIGLDEFPQLAAQAAKGPAPPVPAASEPDPVPTAGSGEPLMLESPAPVAPMAPAAPSLQPHGPALALLGPAGDVRPLADIEADVIRFAIAHYRGQMSEVARKLQIGRSTLYRKLDDLGLEDGERAPSADDTVAAG